MSIKIDNPGMQTTVQDDGRWGYQNVGMSVAGAMDLFAMRCANILVGNDKDEACLEALMIGPSIEFYEDETIAITGADLTPMINSLKVNMWESISVKKGDKLTFGSKKSGLRAYIAFSKTLNVPVVMNSKSTFLRGNLGGFEGRKFIKGDEIKLGNKSNSIGKVKIAERYIPKYSNKEIIRFVFGPQDDAFTDEAKTIFQADFYTITAESDRMGFRLDGAKIEHKVSADIISDGIVFGSIQVPNHGNPIVMMADRQTTGGYTKIGTVITPDLPKLAQMGPGSKIRFKSISIQEAQNIYLKYETNFEEIKNSLIMSVPTSSVSREKICKNIKSLNYMSCTPSKENSYTIDFNGQNIHISIKQSGKW